MKPSERIVIAKQFSPYPAGRYPTDGQFNGSTFRDQFLVPRLSDPEPVVIDIDGVALLPSSFWEEVWGGIMRTKQIPLEQLFTKFRVETTDPELKPYVQMAWRFAREVDSFAE